MDLSGVSLSNSTPMDPLNATVDHAMTDKGRLLTDGTVKSHTVVEFASGKDTHKCQRFNS